MNGLRNPSLLVYLTALFILIAFLLGFTLVVTAAPLSERNYIYHINQLSGSASGTTAQCLAYGGITVQETCPESHNISIFWDVFFTGR
jgi:hypothetical protein